MRAFANRPLCGRFAATFLSFTLALTASLQVASAADADLNLQSTRRTQAPAASLQQPVAVRMGDRVQFVQQDAALTPAQATAVQQILSNGSQSLILNSQGAAVGGLMTLPSTQALSSLIVPRNVTVIADFSSGKALNIGGQFLNEGVFHALSMSDAVHTAAIAMTNFINKPSGLVTTFLPSTQLYAAAANAVPNLSLSLMASKGFVNEGVVSSAANLDVVSANVKNAGTLSAVNQLMVSAPAGNATLVINNANGKMIAPHIVFSNPNAAKPQTTSVLGGSLLSNDVTIFGGAGNATLRVNDLPGVLNVQAGSGAFGSKSALRLGDVHVSGDPTFFSLGDLSISSPIQVDEAITLLAQGNIDLNGMPIVSRQAGDKGFDITMVAGTKLITPVSGGVIRTAGASITGGNITCGSGCSISSESLGDFAGGNILLAAYAAKDGSRGQVDVSGGTITSNSANASAGNVSIIAGSSIITGVLNAIGNTGAPKISLVTANPAGTISADVAGNVRGRLTPSRSINVDGSIDMRNRITAAAGIFSARGGTISQSQPSVISTSALGADLGQDGGSINLYASGDMHLDGVLRTDGADGTPGRKGGNGGNLLLHANGILSGDFGGITMGGAGGPGIFGESGQTDGMLSGTAGGAGGRGGNSGTITVYANKIVGNSSLFAMGGFGGTGGPGGSGVDVATGTAGRGGAGGAGGAGGSAGRISIRARQTISPITVASQGGGGGLGGVGGNGGSSDTGRGGNAGSAGGGGDGGRSANLFVSAGSIASSLNLQWKSGDGAAGGPGGAGGNGTVSAGLGGTGGAGGDAGGAGTISILARSGSLDLGSGGLQNLGGIGGLGGDGGASGSGAAIGPQGASGGAGGNGAAGGNVFLSGNDIIYSLIDIGTAGGAGGDGGNAVAGSSGTVRGGTGGSSGAGGNGGNGGRVSISARAGDLIDSSLDGLVHLYITTSGGRGGKTGTAGSGGTGLDVGGSGGNAGRSGSGGAGASASIYAGDFGLVHANFITSGGEGASGTTGGAGGDGRVAGRGGAGMAGGAGGAGGDVVVVGGSMDVYGTADTSGGAGGNGSLGGNGGNGVYGGAGGAAGGGGFGGQAGNHSVFGSSLVGNAMFATIANGGIGGFAGAGGTGGLGVEVGGAGGVAASGGSGGNGGQLRLVATRGEIDIGRQMMSISTMGGVAGYGSDPGTGGGGRIGGVVHTGGNGGNGGNGGAISITSANQLLMGDGFFYTNGGDGGFAWYGGVPSEAEFGSAGGNGGYGGHGGNSGSIVLRAASIDLPVFVTSAGGAGGMGGTGSDSAASTAGYTRAAGDAQPGGNGGSAGALNFVASNGDLVVRGPLLVVGGGGGGGGAGGNGGVGLNGGGRGGNGAHGGTGGNIGGVNFAAPRGTLFIYGSNPSLISGIGGDGGPGGSGGGTQSGTSGNGGTGGAGGASGAISSVTLSALALQQSVPIELTTQPGGIGGSGGAGGETMSPAVQVGGAGGDGGSGGAAGSIAGVGINVLDGAASRGILLTGGAGGIGGAGGFGSSGIVRGGAGGDSGSGGAGGAVGNVLFVAKGLEIDKVIIKGGLGGAVISAPGIGGAATGLTGSGGAGGNGGIAGSGGSAGSITLIARRLGIVSPLFGAGLIIQTMGGDSGVISGGGGNGGDGGSRGQGGTGGNGAIGAEAGSAGSISISAPYGEIRSADSGSIASIGGMGSSSFSSTSTTRDATSAGNAGANAPAGGTGSHGGDAGVGGNAGNGGNIAIRARFVSDVGDVLTIGGVGGLGTFFGGNGGDVEIGTGGQGGLGVKAGNQGSSGNITITATAGDITAKNIVSRMSYGTILGVTTEGRGGNGGSVAIRGNGGNGGDGGSAGALASSGNITLLAAGNITVHENLWTTPELPVGSGSNGGNGGNSANGNGGNGGDSSLLSSGQPSGNISVIANGDISIQSIINAGGSATSISSGGDSRGGDGTNGGRGGNLLSGQAGARSGDITIRGRDVTLDYALTLGGTGAGALTSAGAGGNSVVGVGSGGRGGDALGPSGATGATGNISIRANSINADFLAAVGNAGGGGGGGYGGAGGSSAAGRGGNGGNASPIVGPSGGAGGNVSVLLLGGSTVSTIGEIDVSGGSPIMGGEGGSGGSGMVGGRGGSGGPAGPAGTAGRISIRANAPDASIYIERAQALGGSGAPGGNGGVGGDSTAARGGTGGNAGGSSSGAAGGIISVISSASGTVSVKEAINSGGTAPIGALGGAGGNGLVQGTAGRSASNGFAGPNGPTPILQPVFAQQLADGDYCIDTEQDVITP